MRKCVAFYLAAICLPLLALSTAVPAATPTIVNYQGFLRDAGGTPLSGTYELTFAVFATPSGPEVPLWEETQLVTVTDGAFDVLLGSLVPLTDVVFSNPTRYLSVRVESDSELLPRMRFAAVPYAQRIGTVDGATGGAITGNTSIGSDLTISGGNLNLDASTATAGNILKGGARFLYNKGWSNTFVGRLSGNLTMSGSFNTVIGDSAFSENTTGYSNTANGALALASNTTGHDNIAIGREVLFNNSTGNNNTAIGGAALLTNIDGHQNTACGSGALTDNTTGGSNTAVGANSLNDNTMGESNTGIGWGAGRSNLTGSRITAIGYASDVGNTGLYNATAIGNSAVVNVSNTMVFGDANVVRRGFGVNAAAGHALEVGTTTNNGNGAYLTTGGNWTNTSDRNTKESITPVDGNELLQKVNQLPLYRWNYKGEDPAHQHVGPMAQDFHDVFGLGDDDKHISTVDPAGVALAAIQALTERVRQQQIENDDLRAQITGLRELIRAQAEK